MEARRVHERGHLSDQLIARATGAAASTVRGWLALRSEPTG
jgi:DNA-binding transcriptional regulator YiaG